MKKISFLSLALFLFLLAGLQAQDKVLSTLPATDQASLRQSMESMGALGEQQLAAMAAGLNAEDRKANGALQYALNGFAAYVMQPGKADWRSKAVQAYGTALGRLDDPENKQFLIRQLQLAGKDDAVPFLKSYLQDAQLVHPAAQALVTINTPLAQQTLLQALSQASEEGNKAALIQALGDSRYTAAVAAVTGQLKPNAGENLKKAVLYALANIGDPASSDILLKAAKQSGYRFSNDNAASDCLLYIQRLIQDGNDRAAGKVVKTLQKKTAKPGSNAMHLALLQFREQLDSKNNGGQADSHNRLTSAEKKEGFSLLFNGKDLDQWTGNKQGYVVEDGNIAVNPVHGSGGNLYTKEEFGNFVFRFQFQLTPGANNGIGIRAPLEGDAAYVGMEIQVLDNTADMYKDLHPYQYHGSVYGVIPAKRGYLKPVGEWNEEEIRAVGPKITVTLNGHVIVDGDIDKAGGQGTADGKSHPGLKNKEGHIGFLGHGSVVKFRDLRVKKL